MRPQMREVLKRMCMPLSWPLKSMLLLLVGLAARHPHQPSGVSLSKFVSCARAYLAKVPAALIDEAPGRSARSTLCRVHAL